MDMVQRVIDEACAERPSHLLRFQHINSKQVCMHLLWIDIICTPNFYPYFQKSQFVTLFKKSDFYGIRGKRIQTQDQTSSIFVKRLLLSYCK